MCFLEQRGLALLHGDRFLHQGHAAVPGVQKCGGDPMGSGNGEQNARGAPTRGLATRSF